MRILFIGDIFGSPGRRIDADHYISPEERLRVAMARQ